MNTGEVLDKQKDCIGQKPNIENYFFNVCYSQNIAYKLQGMEDRELPITKLSVPFKIKSVCSRYSLHNRANFELSF